MQGSPTMKTDSNTSTNNKAAAAHADPNTIMLDVHEIMENLIEGVSNENAEDDPLPTIPNACTWIALGLSAMHTPLRVVCIS
jgi:hypothetical protein